MQRVVLKSPKSGRPIAHATEEVVRGVIDSSLKRVWSIYDDKTHERVARTRTKEEAVALMEDFYLGRSLVKSHA